MPPATPLVIRHRLPTNLPVDPHQGPFANGHDTATIDRVWAGYENNWAGYFVPARAMQPFPEEVVRRGRELYLNGTGPTMESLRAAAEWLTSLVNSTTTDPVLPPPAIVDMTRSTTGREILQRTTGFLSGAMSWMGYYGYPPSNPGPEWWSSLYNGTTLAVDEPSNYRPPFRIPAGVEPIDEIKRRLKLAFTHLATEFGADFIPHPNGFSVRRRLAPLRDAGVNGQTPFEVEFPPVWIHFKFGTHPNSRCTAMALFRRNQWDDQFVNPDTNANSDIPHPHVKRGLGSVPPRDLLVDDFYSGHICLGEVAPRFAPLVDGLLFTELTLLIQVLLETYNSLSPYAPLVNYLPTSMRPLPPATSCHGCGVALDITQVVFLPASTQIRCQSCAVALQPSLALELTDEPAPTPPPSATPPPAVASPTPAAVEAAAADLEAVLATGEYRDRLRAIFTAVPSDSLTTGDPPPEPHPGSPLTFDPGSVAPARATPTTPADLATELQRDVETAAQLAAQRDAYWATAEFDRARDYSLDFGGGAEPAPGADAEPEGMGQDPANP